MAMTDKIIVYPAHTDQQDAASSGHMILNTKVSGNSNTEIMG